MYDYDPEDEYDDYNEEEEEECYDGFLWGMDEDDVDEDNCNVISD